MYLALLHVIRERKHLAVDERHSFSQEQLGGTSFF